MIPYENMYEKKEKFKIITNDLKKKTDENEKQYIWRICSAKEDGILDYSWDEVVNVLNHEIYGDDTENWKHQDTYRKPFQQAKAYYEEVFSKQISNEYSDDILERKRELEKLKTQIQTEKIELNKWKREEARDELLVEKIVQAIKETPIIKPNNKENVKEDSVGNIVRLNFDENDKNERAYILAYGDEHFGTELTIYGLNDEVLNYYSPEIFYERMDLLLDNTKKLIKKENINKLYVYDMGDAIDGILRVSQLMKLRYGVVESAVRYAKYLSMWLLELSECVDSVSFQMCEGNHSEIRHLGQPKGSFKMDNMGKVIFEIIRIYLDEIENIEIKTNKTGMIYENILGYNIVGFHGESKNMEKTLRDFSSIYNVDIDLLIAGHLHHSYNEAVGFAKDVVRTPSIIGVDDFSLKLAKVSDPGATLMVIEKGKGKICDYHIKLTKSEVKQ